MERTIMITIILVLTALISGCGSHYLTPVPTDQINYVANKHVSKLTGSNSDKSSFPSSSDDSNQTNYSSQGSSSQTSSTVSRQSAQASTSQSSSIENVKISSGQAAINYLLDQLKLNNDSDVIPSDMGGSLSTDSEGAYYMIRLVSQSMRAQGGTGTIGVYKVYQNGVYKLIH